MSRPIIKNLIIGSVVVVVVVVLYLMFVRGSSNDSSSALLAVSVEDPATTILGRSLLTALAQLQTTKLDQTFFADPVFRSLSDWSHEIAKQDVGRRNPFAPIGTGGSPATSTPR